MNYRWIPCLLLLLVPVFWSHAQPFPDANTTLEMSTDGTTWSPATPGLTEVSAGQVHFRASLVPAAGGDPVELDEVSASFPTGAGSVEVALERSGDLSVWSVTSPGIEPIDPKIFLRVVTSSEMSLVPAGTFTMGSPDDPAELGRLSDETQHEVTLSRSFYIQQTEVTKAQWDAVKAQGAALGYTDLPVGRNGFSGDASGQHPVTEVSWYDALKWLNLLSELNGLDPVFKVGGLEFRTGEVVPDMDLNASGYRLPTEAEWEYACRAGTATAFHSGDITVLGEDPVDPALDLIAWYRGNSGANTHPVGGKQPNAWGLYDMSGNVIEWCWDRYGLYSGDETDPEGPATGSNQVIRGGIFFYESQFCRSAYRGVQGPQFGSEGVGFRPARTVPVPD